MTRAIAACAVYAVITALYTHPLLFRATEQIANDRFDPVLNASILWWNATTLPFSPAWWTPPHYYPSTGTAAFTENLVGLLPISAPLQWVTGDAILTYNLVFLLTWPLSGFTTFLLVRRITGRSDAAFIAGLVFAFAPYRISQMGHLQVLACFWFPLTLLALHAFVEDRRKRWLVLFGVAWVLQSWTNGYFLLFGGLVIAGWIAYFCSPADRRTVVIPVVATWVVSSVPLLASLLRYRAIHTAYGLERPYGAILAFSAQPSAWWHTSNLAWLWPRWLPDVDPEKNLFPGMTAVVLVITAVLARLRATRADRADGERRRILLARAAAFVFLVSAAVIVVTLAAGPWRITAFGIRSSTIGRPLLIGAVALVVYVALASHARRVFARRSPFVFYVAATLAIVVLSMGPEIRSGRSVLLENAPYAWLLWLPGFNGLRVPPRFWMLGMLCLGVAAGLAFARLAPRSQPARMLLLVLAGAGVLADGWLRDMPMGNPPERWTRVQPANRGRALIELPLGPSYDAAATFRAVDHGRRVVNGVSGYDPPHYAPLQTALNDKDVSLLPALASLGPMDVVVDTRAEGEWERYVASTPGVRRVYDDGTRVLYELPERPPRAAGPQLASKSLTDDERPEPLIDLGSVRPIGAVVLVASDRRETLRAEVVIEVSDGERWREVTRQSTMGAIVVAEMQDPHGSDIILPADTSARLIRVRRVDRGGPWPLHEVRIHAPNER